MAHGACTCDLEAATARRACGLTVTTRFLLRLTRLSKAAVRFTVATMGRHNRREAGCD